MSSEAGDRFLDHVEEYLGPQAGEMPADAFGTDRGFAVSLHNSADGELVSAVTNGLRFRSEVASPLPQELVVTLYADQEDEALHLAGSAAELAISVGEGMEFDEVIPSEEPLVPDTGIYGVIATSHPYIEEDDFENVPDEDGKPTLMILTLVPITRAEIALIEAEGADALYERWESEETDLLDIHREG